MLSISIAACVTFPLSAQVISAFNTGVDDTGAPLDSYSVDSHYQLISSADPQFPGPQTFVVDDTTFPIATGDWIASSTYSKWIAPQADQNYGADPTYGNAVGDYTYRLTFDLSGYEPQLVVLSGQWTCDSAGTDILINGVSTGNSFSSTNPIVPRTWHSFAISTGFVAGTNKLDFVVERVPWFGASLLPTGLRAEVTISILPPPSLSITPAGQFVLIWWPAMVPNFALETSSSLGASQHWMTFNGPVSVIGGQNVIVVDATRGTKFFRLHKL